MKKNNNMVSSYAALLYILRSAPLSFLVMALMGFFNGGVALLSTFCVQKIFSIITLGYSSELYLNLALYAVLLFCSAVYSVWYIRYRVQFHTILNFESVIRKKLHTKSKKISNDMLETPDSFAFVRQADGAKQNLFRFAQIYVESLMLVVQAVMLTAYISNFHMWFFVFVPLAAIPALLERLYQARLWNKTYEEITQREREKIEYEKAISDEIACKETRVTGADRLLIKKYKKSHSEKDTNEYVNAKKLFFLKLALSLFKCIGDVGGFLVSLLLYYYGKITLAEFTASFTAYSYLVAMISSLMSTAGNEAQFEKMIQPYFRYINTSERTNVKNHVQLKNDIVLKDVTFYYPNKKTPALKNINLTIKKNEVLAIVGENGAGKSTLANIIMGLYLPSSGSVFYDGDDIALVREDDIHKNQSAVFQNFVRYKMSVGDNIKIGDQKNEQSIVVEDNINDIFGGTDIDENTLLGKEFGGKELSGGQWQRLAIARCFYKNASFVALDEPTSAIDPLREKEIYDEFENGINGKTAILITHRLGAVKLADKIVVLKDGEIIEIGTHSELLGINGEYHKLWDAQAKAFNEKL